MRGNKDGFRACVEDDLDQVAAVQPQNGPAVGMDIADDFQPAGELLGRLQGRAAESGGAPYGFCRPIYRWY